MASPDNAHPLIRKLESTFTLTDEERDALTNLPMQVMDLKADQDVVREGDRPTRSFTVLEGFACTFKIVGEGKRQIMAFHIPGDIPDLQSLHLKVLDNSVGTITPCKVGFIRHEVLHVDFQRVDENRRIRRNGEKVQITVRREFRPGTPPDETVYELACDGRRWNTGGQILTCVQRNAGLK